MTFLPGHHGFCHNSTKAFVLNSVTIEEGVSKTNKKLRAVIDGCPLSL